MSLVSYTVNITILEPLAGLIKQGFYGLNISLFPFGAKTFSMHEKYSKNTPTLISNIPIV